MRSVVALYENFVDAQGAVKALTNGGFSPNDINLIASDAAGDYTRYFEQDQVNNIPADQHQDVGDGAAAGAGIGAVLGGLGGLLVGLGALAIPGIGPVLAAGPIVAALAGAGVGAVAGGLVGALVDLGVPEEHAQLYAEGIRRGGTLLTVRTDDERAEEARNILNRFNPVDIDERMQSWQENRWSTSDVQSQTNVPVTGMHDTTFRNDEVMDDAMATDQENEDLNNDWGRNRSIDNQFETGMDDHLNQDVFSNERAHDKVVDNIPVTGGMLETEDVEMVESEPMVGDDWDRYDSLFQQDFQTRFGSGPYGYDYYQPAYRYGYDLANDPRYRDMTWEDVEPYARADYQRSGAQGAWYEIKDAVRHAWDSIVHH